MKLEIKNLSAKVEDKEILRGLSLEINSGEVHAIMGPNGAGKSTLSHVIMGNPRYEVSGGEILLDGENLLEMETDERARLGLFMAFQYPVEIPGITVGRFLKRATEIQGEMKPGGFVKKLRETMKFLDIDQQFINRYLNEGFSGGEKKRMEILQMLVLKPGLGILDETDSGLDIDALQVVAKGVNRLRGEDFAAIIITHYQRILNHIKPDYVHILYQGRIVKSGSEELVHALEEKGYNWIREEYPEEVANER